MRGLRAALIGIPPVVLLVVLILLAMPFCATCGGHSEAVTDLVKRCKRATELLGDDAHPARMGVACGQTETSGGNGHASWNLPYTGSRDRGAVSFDAIKRGGMWTIDRAALEVGSETIDLIACVGTPQPPPVAATLSQTNADDAQANFAGKIIRSTHPTLGVGIDCSGSLARERGSPTAHVTVTCGGAPLYDARGSFKLDVQNPARRDDDHLEYEDVTGSPACRLSAANGKGTLTVWSAAPAWELVVDL